jgi:hypothetical protein
MAVMLMLLVRMERYRDAMMLANGKQVEGMQVWMGRVRSVKKQYWEIQIKAAV